MKNTATKAYWYRQGGLDSGTKTFWIPQKGGVIVVDVHHYPNYGISSVYLSEHFGGDLKDKSLNKVIIRQEVVDQILNLIQMKELLARSLSDISMGKKTGGTG